MISRMEVLGRIRQATGSGAADPAMDYAVMERNYVCSGRLPSEARVALMIERLREYDAEVVECSPDELVQTITAQLSASGRRVFVAPPGLPPAWLIPGIRWRIDDGLTTEQIDRTEGVVTACFCGVADSGTIVLHHSQIEGRRLISLLPEWHLCILRESDIVETLPEYFARCTVVPRLATYISGPSATADIEMTRIKGVHGPPALTVIVLRNSRCEDRPDGG